ncbi:hypothetical protein B0H15DRAFT_815334 [Mycena belliarum]|uniref:Uncharacterized protein n=1 Tax=Mycena belliarum TaxID=1033014 RepID=A0AAD6UGM3_9AGAR|nr:hypothetical protein B0H15DRAFT_815334 [Mycena belliae]
MKQREREARDRERAIEEERLNHISERRAKERQDNFERENEANWAALDTEYATRTDSHIYRSGNLPVHRDNSMPGRSLQPPYRSEQHYPSYNSPSTQEGLLSQRLISNESVEEIYASVPPSNEWSTATDLYHPQSLPPPRRVTESPRRKRQPSMRAPGPRLVPPPGPPEFGNPVQNPYGASQHQMSSTSVYQQAPRPPGASPYRTHNRQASMSSPAINYSPQVPVHPQTYYQPNSAFGRPQASGSRNPQPAQWDGRYASSSNLQSPTHYNPNAQLGGPQFKSNFPPDNGQHRRRN